MARPSSLTAERREADEKALAAGAPLAVAAASAEVSARTLSRWLEQGHVARRTLALAPEPEPEAVAPGDELDVERALVSVVMRHARHDWFDVYVYVDDLAALYDELVGRGAEIVHGPVDQEYGIREFRVRDPHGYILAFGEAS